jgi:Zn-finger nucleic acid-binding protein
MADRQGIEIDYCPQCRGVWLDRGELDKIIERSQAAAPRPYRDDDDDDDDRRRRDMHPQGGQPQGGAPYGAPHHGGQPYGKPYKKKKSLLSEIFDFD